LRPWTVPWKLQGIVLENFPALKAWFERMEARPAVKKAMGLAEAVRRGPGERNGGEQQPRGVPDRNGMYVRHSDLPPARV